jgi:DNA invertase Pin-like site-specific DNA recombinase
MAASAAAAAAANTATFTVSAEQAALVQRLLAQNNVSEIEDGMSGMAMGAASAGACLKAAEVVDEEVDSVIGHRMCAGGVWQFNIRFKKMGRLEWEHSTEWVNDEDCNCEELIGAYLRNCGINTVYIWCRVSTKAQADAISLGAQAQQLSAWVAGWLVSSAGRRIKVVQVAGSAYRNIPIKLQDIGNGATAGDAIVFYRVDRLSRNIVASLEWLQGLNARGVEVLSFEGGESSLRYSTNPLEFHQRILDAQKESAMIGKRVKMSINARKVRGDVMGSAPYGMMNVRNEATGVISRTDCPAEQRVIQKIMEYAINPQRPRDWAQEIANDFASKGQLKRGRKWSTAMVNAVAKAAPPTAACEPMDE